MDDWWVTAAAFHRQSQENGNEMNRHKIMGEEREGGDKHNKNPVGDSFHAPEASLCTLYNHDRGSNSASLAATLRDKNTYMKLLRGRPERSHSLPSWPSRTDTPRRDDTVTSTQQRSKHHPAKKMR